jgi:hypothetical protein
VTYGDRVALRSFCKSTSIDSKEKDKSVKSLMERINHSLSGTSKSKTNWHTLPGNKNAVKIERRIELGWLNDEGDEFKQVKQPRGGGTRHLTLPVSVPIEEILHKGKEIFFPDGKSPHHGKADDYNFSVSKFDHIPVSGSVTLGELYGSTKVKLLRLYICTRKKNCHLDDNENSDGNEWPVMCKTKRQKQPSTGTEGGPEQRRKLLKFTCVADLDDDNKIGSEANVSLPDLNVDGKKKEDLNVDGKKEDLALADGKKEAFVVSDGKKEDLDFSCFLPTADISMNKDVFSLIDSASPLAMLTCNHEIGLT